MRSNVVSIIFVVLLHNVIGQKPQTFPKPTVNTKNPHSACRKWREDQINAKGVSAKQKGIEPANRSQRLSGSQGFIGACGVKYSADDAMVCIWNGAKGPKDPNYVQGWLTGELNGLNNCFKKVTVTANGRSVTATIADGCPFSSGKPVDIDHGCSDISISDKVLSDLGFPKDARDVRITSWDFLPDAENQAW